jgi:NADP-dependent 3-hydroxy acid dehydrogenase YdfG
MQAPSGPRIALVTGAGSGIGRAVALGLSQDDFPVVLSGRRRGLLEEVAATVQPLGKKALAVSADVHDITSVQALFEKIESNFGRR